jgi:hypothetical protein
MELIQTREQTWFSNIKFLLVAGGGLFGDGYLNSNINLGILTLFPKVAIAIPIQKYNSETNAAAKLCQCWALFISKTRKTQRALSKALR